MGEEWSFLLEALPSATATSELCPEEQRKFLHLQNHWLVLSILQKILSAKQIGSFQSTHLIIVFLLEANLRALHLGDIWFCPPLFSLSFWTDTFNPLTTSSQCLWARLFHLYFKFFTCLFLFGLENLFLWVDFNFFFSLYNHKHVLSDGLDRGNMTAPSL